MLNTEREFLGIKQWGLLVQSRLKERDIAQGEAAKLLGIHPAYLSTLLCAIPRKKRGHPTTPSISFLIRLEDIYQIPLDEQIKCLRGQGFRDDITPQNTEELITQIMSKLDEIERHLKNAEELNTRMIFNLGEVERHLKNF